MRIAGRAVFCPSTSVATRRLVSAMPCAGCVGLPGAEGKVRIMDVLSSAPVRAYLEIEETTVGGLRSAGGRVW